MLIYLLIALIGIQILIQVPNRHHIKLRDIIDYLLPYWHKGDLEDRILGVLQLFIVGCISLMGAVKAEDLSRGVLIFLLTFISFIWGIKMLIYIMEWLQAYISTMTVNLVFALVVPMMILFNLNRIDSVREIQVCFAGLMMSLLMVYFELISIVLGRGTYKASKKHLMHNGAMILGSIMTWLMVIIINLYTLLLFIQFYMEPSLHPFVEAEQLTKASAIDLFYYLVMTFTTVGFGDISPHTLMAKVISSLVALSGMIFTGIFVGCVLNLKE